MSSIALDACVRIAAAPLQRFPNTAEGVAALAAFCRAHGVTLVVMEATGGYEQRPFAGLWAEDMPAAIVNPRSVRRFAEGMGLMEKTDRIDAGVIAWYAETKRITAQPPAGETQQQLTAWAQGCASSPSCAWPRATSAAWWPMPWCSRPSVR